MSFSRGERVYLSQDAEIGDLASPEQKDAPKDAPPPSLASAFVGDILERPAGAANPPIAPTLKTSVNGFPAHKKRTPRASAFEQQRAVGKQAARSSPAPKFSHEDEEKRQIHEENRQKLASMSEEQIAQSTEEIRSALSESVIQKLLRRANLNDGSNERNLGLDVAPPPAEATDNDSKAEPETNPAKKVSFAPEESVSPPAAATEEQDTPHNSSSHTPSENPDPTTTANADFHSLHLPQPKQPPDLDPSDPDFLEKLHTKYFPNVAYDPSSLSWMAPIDPNDKKSPYHPSQTAYNTSDLRFDFKGNLLAPSVAREIPVTQGLHHHGDAPEAAGYTIPELAVMARSAVAAQRCVAYQTLGRILYRLGQGEFGFEKVRRRTDGPVQVARDPSIQEDEVDEDDIEVDMEDAGSAMAAGLWACVEEGRVIETLTEEAGRKSGHFTAKSFAEEALWNWRAGGGRKRQAV